MDEKNFSEKWSDGWIEYETRKVESFQESRIVPKEWHDGFFAFSTCEKKLSTMIPLIENPSYKGFDKADEKIGYLMEIDLWKTDSAKTIFSEIVLEREDDGYFLQKWTLYTRKPKTPDDSPQKLQNVFYYQNVLVSPRRNNKEDRLIGFEALRAIEIISPSERLHFFLTVAEGNDETANQ